MTERPAMATRYSPSFSPFSVIVPFPPHPSSAMDSQYPPVEEGDEAGGDPSRKEHHEVPRARQDYPGAVDMSLRYPDPPVVGRGQAEQQTDPQREGPRDHQGFPPCGHAGPAFHDSFAGDGTDETPAKAGLEKCLDGRASPDGATDERQPAHIRRGIRFQHLGDYDPPQTVPHQVYPVSAGSLHLVDKSPCRILQLPFPGRVPVIFDPQAGTLQPAPEVPQIPVRSPEAMQEDDRIRMAMIRLYAIRQDSPPKRDYTPYGFPSHGHGKHGKQLFILKDRPCFAYSCRTF